MEIDKKNIYLNLGWYLNDVTSQSGGSHYHKDYVKMTVLLKWKCWLRFITPYQKKKKEGNRKTLEKDRLNDNGWNI